ncbi:unnamed protein product [Microthlaspi erraticum]|uniref:Uncharacterized protein n=1 Tax=Microthlaspi erraticum TaxID=1685480 RepID=A0A6D2KKW9_9BRAS|nr:unnamed protein product [Microthlaspi erraticum]
MIYLDLLRRCSRILISFCILVSSGFERRIDLSSHIMKAFLTLNFSRTMRNLVKYFSNRTVNREDGSYPEQLSSGYRERTINAPDEFPNFVREGFDINAESGLMYRDFNASCIEISMLGKVISQKMVNRILRG